MKKYLSLLLAVLLLLALCGCSEEGPSYTEVPIGNVQFVSCQFVREVRAADGEVKTQFYQQVENKIYVDLWLSVTNTSTQPMGKESFSASLHYNETLYPMQYCRETENGTIVDETPIPAGGHSYVHMFTQIPQEAVEDDLSVSYQVGNKTYWTKVERTPAPLTMTGKTRVKVGEKVQIPNVDCQLTVLEMGFVEQLQASRQTESYYPGPYALVKLQLENNHKTATIGEIFSYTVKNGQQVAVQVEVENEQGTALESFSQLEPGQETVIYLFTKLDKDEILDDGMIRFNIAGSCYYVRMK